jgi:hypothetical protein
MYQVGTRTSLFLGRSVVKSTFVRYISTVRRAENGRHFIFDVVQQADMQKYIRYPSTYRIGAQMLANLTIYFSVRSTNFHKS